MAEVRISIIVFGSSEIFNSMELCLPVSFTLVHSVTELEKRVGSCSKIDGKGGLRSIILLLESLGEDVDYLYTKMEENPEILYIFHVWNQSVIPTSGRTKLLYISKESTTLILTFSIINILKQEADKQQKVGQLKQTKIYLRQAEKIRDWFMCNLRAEPCHILVIPLNTHTKNLYGAVQNLQQTCKNLGFPSAIVRSLDEYIPQGELCDKLPYAKFIFEYEDPKIVCRWLRNLSPIRMYLYGNEQIIPYEWSKQMALNETDHAEQMIVNDDNWYVFIENELVKDDIKWNFAVKHGREWEISQYAAINLKTMEENLRLRSALRRAHKTFSIRMTNVTAEICDWFDECMTNGYIQNEFKLHGRDKSHRTEELKISEDYDDVTETMSDVENFEQIKYSSNPITNYYENRFDRTYIWLSDDFDLIEERFQSKIYPNRWKNFSAIDDCQIFIKTQQLQYNTKIILFSVYDLAKQLFTYEHISNIYAAYLYSDQENISSDWIQTYPMIRGIYTNFDSLYEQFNKDLISNIELTKESSKTKNGQYSLPILIINTDPDEFKRRQTILEILLKLPRSIEAKNEMIHELHRESNDNEPLSRQIDDFEQNYHSNEAIHWYTRDSFLYRIINEVLCSGQIEKIIKYRFFIVDMYQQLVELHNQIVNSNYFSQKPLTFYRGQSLLLDEIEIFKNNVGNLGVTNAFFSTTSSLDIALIFAGGQTLEGIALKKPVVFCIEVDPNVQNTKAFANINLYSSFKGEDEVLFAMGTIFRIEDVQFLSVNDNVPVIHLKMVDEKEALEELNTISFASIVPEQPVEDPIYTVVGLTHLFDKDEQSQKLKNIFENINVQFFENTNDLDHYTKSIKRIQSFVVFMLSQLHIPQYFQQRKLISFDEYDMHFNDLIYQMLNEMENNKLLKNQIKDLFMNITNTVVPSLQRDFYVLLLLNRESRNKFEDEIKTKFPSLSLIIFYKTEQCIYFLKSINEQNKIGNAILTLQSDDENIDETINEFEDIYSIKYMYICSKRAFDIKYRRIIHGKFQNTDDLYTQLYSQNLFNSFTQANQQIDYYKNRQEAQRLLEQSRHFHQLLTEHQNRERNIEDLDTKS